MRLLDRKPGLTLRLGAMIVALLVGQQAMAVGTRAGTSIENTASVDYSVGGIDQEDIASNQVTFVVDRRVDFLLEPIVPGTLEDVTPGENEAWVDFRLTNTSNSDLDFNLLLAQLTDGTAVGPGTDNADMAAVEYAVSADLESLTNPDPVQGGDQYVDELPPDESIRIRVWGDAALTMVNAEVAGVELTATAAEPGTSGTEGGALAYGVANNDATIENVAANNAGGGVEVASDGFVVVSAGLSVAKAYAVIDDGFGGTLPIPGAEVEYTITIVNSSTTTPADSVVITDTLDGDLVFLADALAGGADMTLTVNAGLPTGCTEEADADGCLRSGADLTFDNITIAAGDTLVVTYRVTIADPATTP